MDQFNRIIESALNLFMREGVKTVNMDDISSFMGISKKTLYQYVNNKADLVEKAFRLYQSRILGMISNIQEKNENAIDELFKIDEKLCLMLKNRPPRLINNLKKYYPNVWEILDEIKKKHLFTCITENMDRGKEQGLYRNEVNSNIIAKLMMNTVDALVDDATFPLTQYDFKSLLKRKSNLPHTRNCNRQGNQIFRTKKIKK